MRAGTSKGPFFDLRDLPVDVDERNQSLLQIMGSPSSYQVDGIGGGMDITSKVVMVRPSEIAGVDVDYLLAQVFVDQAVVDLTPTCGNMMSGVAPFAIEKGWVNAQEDITSVNVYNMNTDSHIEIDVHTRDGQVIYTQGDFTIDGVPGSASPILMKLKNIEGGRTGKLFPTGYLKDTILGKEVSMVDAGNLMIHLRASDFNLTGEEKGSYFNDKTRLMAELERIRRSIAVKAGLKNVANSVLPKIGLLSPPNNDGHLHSLYFTPSSFHPTHAISGAISVAVGSKCKGSIAAEMYRGPKENANPIILEHQSGTIPIELQIEGEGLGCKVISAGVYRTARKMMEGYVYY